MKVQFLNGTMTYARDENEPFEIPHYLSYEGSVFDGESMIPGTEVKKIVLCEGIAQIGTGVFSCASIKELYIPDGVTEIFPYALSNCRQLQRLSLPSSLLKIGANALSGCVSLRQIEFRGGWRKELKIGSNVMRDVLHINNTDILFEMQTSDEFLAYLFNKQCADDPYVPMKQRVLLSYLKGKPASGEFEKALIRFAKKQKEALMGSILDLREPAVAEAFVKLLAKEKDAAELMHHALVKVQSMNEPEMVAALLAIQKKHSIAPPKETNPLDLSAKTPTAADWKKCFKLKDLGDSYLIRSYLGTEADVVVPETICTKSVKAIDKGTFAETAVERIDSPVCPYLGDFYGRSVFPEVCIYKRAELKVKAKTAAPERAAVDQFVTFGRYPQERLDGAMRPIIWRVLKKEGNELLLQSRYALEVLPMHGVRAAVSWKDCDLRRWLNELFYAVAFDDAEKAKICTVKNRNPQHLAGEDPATEDKVFLLSWEEYTALRSIVSKDVDYTDHADVGKTLYGEGRWFRTNGKQKTKFAAKEGRVDKENGFYCDLDGAVYPVIRIRL